MNKHEEINGRFLPSIDAALAAKKTEPSGLAKSPKTDGEPISPDVIRVAVTSAELRIRESNALDVDPFEYVSICDGCNRSFFCLMEFSQDIFRPVLVSNYKCEKCQYHMQTAHFD